MDQVEEIKNLKEEIKILRAYISVLWAASNLSYNTYEMLEVAIRKGVAVDVRDGNIDDVVISVNSDEPISK